MSRNKDRNQSVHSFFESLQLEYMIALIRSKIYPSSNDRKYYKNRVMTGKRRKIEEISARNTLVSIFDSEEVFDQYYTQASSNWGFPLFNYPDEKTKAWQFSQDRINYLAKDSELTIRNQRGSISVGVVKDNSSILSSNIVTVRMRGESKDIVVSIENVKRIL